MLACLLGVFDHGHAAA